MSKILTLVVCLLGTSYLRAADDVLSNPVRGELQLIGKEVVFTPKESVLDSLSDPGIFLIVPGGGVLLSAGLQDIKPYRPTERIIAGGIGNYNVGGLSPCAGIPIFIATANQRPQLAGISNANGSFAVKLPQHENGSEIFIFFNGEIEVLNIPKPDDQMKDRVDADNELQNGNQNLFLKTGTSTVRYRVSIQEAEQVGTGQPSTRPESKSKGNDKPQPEAEGRAR